MYRTPYKGIVLAVTGALALSGCSGLNPFATPSPAEPSATSGNFSYQGHDFGANRDAGFRHGVIDGCKTAGGHYTKNHTLFRGNPSYKAGWENGRLTCGT